MKQIAPPEVLLLPPGFVLVSMLERRLHHRPAEVEWPYMSGTDNHETRPGGAAGITCDACQALLEAFMEAVRELVILHERHVLAVVNEESDPHRFDLLIHEATERKQNAKYAYVHHRETHGCSSKKNETDRN